jgi:hypothetical protein
MCQKPLRHCVFSDIDRIRTGQPWPRAQDSARRDLNRSFYNSAETLASTIAAKFVNVCTLNTKPRASSLLPSTPHTTFVVPAQAGTHGNGTQHLSGRYQTAEKPNKEVRMWFMRLPHSRRGFRPSPE